MQNNMCTPIIFYLTDEDCYTGPNSLIVTSTYSLIIRSPNSFTEPHHVQCIRSLSHMRVRFAAIPILRSISDFYLKSTNKQGGAFQNTPDGDNGLRHVMSGGVSQCQLTIGLPYGFARIPPYPFPCNEILFDRKGPYHICAHLTSCSAFQLSQIFWHWNLDETLLNSEKLTIQLRYDTTKYSDNLACHRMGQPILRFRRSTRSSCCARMALLHNVCGASSQAVALLEEVAKLNTVLPDVWLIPSVMLVIKAQ